MGVGSGSGADDIQRQSSRGGGDLAGGGPDPRRGPDYHNIGLVEVVWKAVKVILICYFAASIICYESLHGFRSGRGTGTVSLEVKILQKVMAMMEEVLYMILLDLYKEYDAFERSRYMEILEGYGGGARYLFLR